VSKVEEIEDAIRGLSGPELDQFREWFAAYDAVAWDEQIERDAAAGRLDRFAEEALSDLREGRCTER
jgi:hypothetical protein